MGQPLRHYMKQVVCSGMVHIEFCRIRYGWNQHRGRSYNEKPGGCFSRQIYRYIQTAVGCFIAVEKNGECGSILPGPAPGQVASFRTASFSREGVAHPARFSDNDDIIRESVTDQFGLDLPP